MRMKMGRYRAPGSVVVSHVHGNANVRQACLALAEEGMLDSFWTALAWKSNASGRHYLPQSLNRQLERRSLPGAVQGHVRTHPWREIARLAWERMPIRPVPNFLSPDSCAEGLDRRVARYLASAAARNADSVYAYDHGAVSSFRVAERLGMARIYELPIGYWRAHEAILTEESERWPQWCTPGMSVDFGSPKFLRKDEEIGRASCVYVPSRFVQRSLQSYKGSLPPVHVIPYGAPDAVTISESEFDRSHRGPLRVLYVGALGLRKGAPYLFSALDHFGSRIERTVVGRMTGQSAPMLEALSKGRWIESLPRSDILSLMRESDVFVFPTLFEGMALVVLEAMAQGCAVITTPNSGAEDIVEHGVNGFIVPVRSSDAIVQIMEMLDGDRDNLRSVRFAASQTTAAHSWMRYREKLVKAVKLEAASQASLPYTAARLAH